MSALAKCQSASQFSVLCFHRTRNLRKAFCQARVCVRRPSAVQSGLLRQPMGVARHVLLFRGGRRVRLAQRRDVRMLPLPHGHVGRGQVQPALAARRIDTMTKRLSEDGEPLYLSGQRSRTLCWQMNSIHLRRQGLTLAGTGVILARDQANRGIFCALSNFAVSLMTGMLRAFRSNWSVPRWFGLLFNGKIIAGDSSNGRKSNSHSETKTRG
jgi:hypothetical protein